MPYAGSEGPDQPAHSRSLIRNFRVRLLNQWILQNISKKREDLDQNARTSS